MMLQMCRVILMTLENNFPLSSPPLLYAFAKPRERSLFYAGKETSSKEVEHRALSRLSVSGSPNGSGHPE